MKFLKALLIFIIILLLSAFLAPFIYKIAPFKFERILSRLVMVFSLLAIVFFVRIRRRDLEKYGFSAADNWLSLLRQGFAAGFLTLAVLTGLEILMGGRMIAPNLDPWWHMLIRTAEYVLASLVIGFTEELFFRGFLFTQIRMKCPVGLSFAATNLVYAALHFFKGGTYPVPANPGFVDGLKVVAHLADSFLSPAAMWPTFLGLFLFGAMLSYAFQKTGSLYLSIGLHAGSVFFLKVDNWFVASVPQASPLLFGDKNLHSGFLGWIFIGLLFLWVSRRAKRL